MKINAIRIIIVVMVLSLLTACEPSLQTGTAETSIGVAVSTPDSSTTAPIRSAVPSPSFEPTSSPASVSDAEPLKPSGGAAYIRVSSVFDDSCIVVSAYDDKWGNENPDYVYLYTDEPVYNILISDLRQFTEGAEPLETSAYLYVSELAPQQAVRLYDAYPHLLEGGETYWTQISYTTSAGEFVVAMLLGEKENENTSLTPVEQHLTVKKYDEKNFSYGNIVPDDFRTKVLSGAFEDYIPNGMAIATGSLSDVNGDGVEDALICLATGGHRIEGYVGIMPMFVLVGKPDGRYIVEKRNIDALFTPYRSSSYAIAGNEFIDMVYDYVDGAGCHHTYVSRFWYDAEANDWMLKEFSHQPTYMQNYSELMVAAFVSALPSFAGMPIAEFNTEMFYGSPADWDYFDAVGTLTIPLWGGENSETYTLAVNINLTTGFYEGYIHKYYKSLDGGGFFHTIRGQYRTDSELTIFVGEDNRSFTIQDDVWKMDEGDEDAFYLVD